MPDTWKKEIESRAMIEELMALTSNPLGERSLCDKNGTVSSFSDALLRKQLVYILCFSHFGKNVNFG